MHEQVKTDKTAIKEMLNAVYDALQAKFHSVELNGLEISFNGGTYGLGGAINQVEEIVDSMIEPTPLYDAIEDYLFAKGANGAAPIADTDLRKLRDAVESV